MTRRLYEGSCAELPCVTHVRMAWVNCKELFPLSTPYFCAGSGENHKISHSYKKASANNILIVFFIKKFCVKKMPLVAQILGNGFKERPE